MIELKDITLLKGGRKLFSNFSLKIERGEHWVIQGPNGAGKTLLLQLIAGLIHPAAGEVRHSFIHADNWDTYYQQRSQKIHFVPTHWIQSFLNGFDGLFYQQRYYSVDDANLPKVRDAFGDDLPKLKALDFSERFNINHLLDLEVTRLSNGQLKKVIIMRQLVRSIPNFLLLDYPFDGLDAESRHDLLGFVDEIASKFGTQIIMVDHGPRLPGVINKRLVLHNFTVDKVETVIPNQAHPTPQVSANTVAKTLDTPAVVEMKDLTIAYRGKKIISGLNWRINRGERWALTGRNGSGKTTLFSLIYADHPMAYSQKVFLFGRRRGSGESIWDIKKRINYFGPEQIHFLNGGSLVSSGRAYIRTLQHKNPSRLDDLVNFFNAGHYIDEPMRNLSSGQLQVVLLMNMFLDDKELLLLDEPFQFLDHFHHERLTQYLSHYLNKDITLVLITHDERDVAKWTQLRKRLESAFDSK